MLGVFINLLYTYAMPNNHYCSKPTSLRCHLMAKRYRWELAKLRSEARNLPTWSCKSMAEGLTIMLGVFIILLCTYTMPNNHYCSKPTSLRCHLMAKRYLKVGKKSRSEARNPRIFIQKPLIYIGNIWPGIWCCRFLLPSVCVRWSSSRGSYGNCCRISIITN